MALLSMLGETGDAGFDTAIDAAGSYDFSDATDWFSEAYAFDWLNSSAPDASAATAPDVSAMGFGDEQMRSVASAAAEAKDQPVSMVDRLFGWFDKQDKATKGAMTTLAGSFLKGAFGYKDSQRALRSAERSSEASMLNAQTNASALESKNAQLANSQLSRTSFGAKPGGLIYSNKLAGRQARAGYGG